MPATIELAKVDITRIRVDAIVNAANEALQLGSGVAGAIRQHGGPAIQEECDRIGTCAVGQAVVTKAGNLPARWVIHAVGPVWKGGSFGEEMLLASAVLQALRRGEDIGAASVALPAISTGVFGFPLPLAAEITVAAAKSFAPNAEYVQKIVFCLLDDDVHDAFQKALGK
ncbi:MAG TPA: macro domain-containing protein [Thermoanaerobaculia bacterium]|nr:macro domain-containing protein [Thermoanaerobaculia bacterium]